MPYRPLTKSETAARIRAVESALRKGHHPKTAARIAADALGIGHNTMRMWLREARPEIDWKLYKEPKPKQKAIRQAEDLKARRSADELQRLRQNLRTAERQLNAAEDLRSAVFGLTQPRLAPPTWTIAPRAAKTSPGIPILLTSDFQWGETVAAREMDGINAFNINIAEERYQRLIDRTIDLTHSHMVKPDYQGLIYLRGGDMISGDIHQELRETNDLQSLPAVRSLVNNEIEGLRQLRAKFKRLRVISVPGNHGRTTHKPQSKRYAETNYDTLSAWMLEQWFQAKGDDGITFHTPESGDALFSVLGWQFLLTHGDRIGSRGGTGFIGPSATIARGMKKLRDYYAELGQLIDYILCGHFHTRLELEYGFSNGCLPGASEYARDGRFIPKPPSQWLLFCHKDYGVTARWPIFLETRARMARGDDVFERAA